jgi:FkbM family methyltransferase
MFFRNRKYRKSYSQCGEDVIVDRILSLLDIQKPTFLDIGANDPILRNNTYFLYEKGFRGVNIEPDPFLFKCLKTKRHGDINLNIGIGPERGKLTFYVMSSRTLSTFSKETAERYVNYGNQKIEKTISIDVHDINFVIEKFFSSRPNYVSMDVEGLEMDILRTLDINNRRPDIFCIETLIYTENNTETKLSEIIEFMQSAHYTIISDTYINTIFVDATAWKNRGKKIF